VSILSRGPIPTIHSDMTLLAGALLGLLVGVIVFLVLFRTANRERSDVSALISGVKGEERLRALELNVQGSIRELRDALNTIDQARSVSLARLDTVIGESQRTIGALQRSTSKLAETLSSSQARGQLGERLADDVLRAAGFVEGVNYQRNRQMAGGTNRPDFTFTLPEGRTLNMDVKFPLASYVRYVEFDDGPDRDAALKQFLTDVWSTIRSVATRDYVDTSRGTLAFMLVFVPNEQIFGFIHECDSGLADEARGLGVVLCSPLTLFALLSVIRQAADAFALASDADEVLRALSGFSLQWEKYQESVVTVGRRLESAQRAFDEMHGPRTRALNKQLGRVEELRKQRNLPLPVGDAEDELGDRDSQGSDPEQSADRPSRPEDQIFRVRPTAAGD
jgi:DNA recombination protein RmuC